MSRAQQALAQDHPEGSRGREPVLVHRHRRHQHHAEQRPHPDQPEAARRAQDQRQRRHPPPAAASSPKWPASRCSCSRCRTHRGGPRQPHAVPVHAGRSQRRRAEHLRSAACWPSCKRCRSCATSPATSRISGLRAKLVFDRDTASRLGITPSTHRSDALRRLRPAPGLHHLHAVEPVPRGPGSDARLSAAIRWICAISTSAPAPRPPPAAPAWSPADLRPPASRAARRIPRPTPPPHRHRHPGVALRAPCSAAPSRPPRRFPMAARCRSAPSRTWN